MVQPTKRVLSNWNNLQTEDLYCLPATDQIEPIGQARRLRQN